MISANIPNEVRKAIYQRDGYACVCGDNRSLNIHHVLPRGNGGGNSPCNLITLCRYCHAAAHGTCLSEFYIPPEDVEQACVEYLQDMYLQAYDPWAVYDYDNPEMVKKALDEIDFTMRQQGRTLL